MGIQTLESTCEMSHLNLKRAGALQVGDENQHKIAPLVCI